MSFAYFNETRELGNDRQKQKVKNALLRYYDYIT